MRYHSSCVGETYANCFQIFSGHSLRAAIGRLALSPVPFAEPPGHFMWVLFPLVKNWFLSARSSFKLCRDGKTHG